MNGVLGINNIRFGGIVSQVCAAGFGSVGPMPLVLKLHFWACSWPFLVMLFLPEFAINGIVGFQFLGGGVPRSASCGVCVSGIVRFAGASNRAAWFVLQHRVSFLVLHSPWLRLLSVLRQWFCCCC